MLQKNDHAALRYENVKIVAECVDILTNMVSTYAGNVSEKWLLA
mgnify:FL=1